jgi:hypothetical protein
VAFYHAARSAEVVGRPVKPFSGSSDPSDLILNALMEPSSYPAGTSLSQMDFKGLETRLLKTAAILDR